MDLGQIDLSSSVVYVVIISIAGAFGLKEAVPKFIEYLHKRHDGKLKELQLHIIELEAELKLEKERRHTEYQAHKNLMERMNHESEKQKNELLVLRMKYTTLTGLVNTSLSREEMITVIKSLDSDESNLTSAKT